MTYMYMRARSNQLAIIFWSHHHNKKPELSMRPIHGCPENFPESLTTPTVTFREIFNRLLFRSILWLRLQNLNFVVLPFPEMGTQKNWAVPGYTHARFSPKFLMGFCSDGPCECTRQIWRPYRFTRSRDNKWLMFWVGVANLRTYDLGEEEAVGGRDGTVRKSVGEFLYRP